MNSADARHTLLVRAFEDPPVAPWSTADAAWASAEAARHEGEAAAPERLIARRARLAATRLAEREPAVATALAADGAPHWLGWALVALAFAGGVAIDRVGGAQRINILAPPLLALLAWNVAVYLLLALRAPWPRATRPRALFARKPLDQPPALARFAAEWARLAQPLAGARLAAVLHAAAAALALGALASLYLRGLAFEYRAGWDSTFLGPAAVHRLLAIVLGPASQLSGLALPDVQKLAALRFSTGPGENAARWIHLYALTVGLVVVLPRTLLAAASTWRSRRLSSDVSLPLDEPYFRRLLHTRGEPAAVQVVPYSYALQREAWPGLEAVLEDELGSRVALRVAEPVTQGHEDAIGELLPAPAALVALFALTATPERESHGEFIDALAARRPAAARLVVLVDESGFRRRFGDDVRLEQRRGAWQRLLQEHGQTALFADLGAHPNPLPHAGEGELLPLPQRGRGQG